MTKLERFVCVRPEWFLSSGRGYTGNARVGPLVAFDTLDVVYPPVCLCGCDGSEAPDLRRQCWCIWGAIHTRVMAPVPIGAERPSR